MRSVLLACAVFVLGVTLPGCLKTTAYKPVPAPAGPSWGIERDRLSQSTMTSTSYQQESAYDNKVYNVYVTKMSQTLGESYSAQGTYEAIEKICPDPGKGKCKGLKLPYRPLNELPRK